MTSCGDEESGESGGAVDPTIKFYLDRAATALDHNSLMIVSDARAGYRYSLSGIGFESEVALGAIHPVRNETVFNYTAPGTYYLDVTIFNADGTTFARDQLSWEYSKEEPPNSSVSMAAKATSDETAVFYFSTQRGDKVNDVHIVGDIHPSAQSINDWYEIPASGELALKMSDGDGLKKFVAKLRNKFYNETPEKSLEIIRKSTGPKSCQVVAIAKTTNSETIEYYIAADDPYPLQYAVRGSGTILTTFVEFTGSTTDFVVLKNGEGEREVKILVKDIAEHTCETTTDIITVDYDYKPIDVNLADNIIWTTESTVTVLPHYDHFPHINVEMYIGGGVVADDKTFRWIPYADSIELDLVPVNGHRSVDVQFRDSRGGEDHVLEHVFLRPYLAVTGTAPNRELLISPIYYLTDVTIVGCSETYDHIEFVFSVPCTPTGATATATYYLEDGTTVAATATF